MTTGNDKCSVPGCEGRYHASGLCKKHYRAKQYRANKDLLDTAKASVPKAEGNAPGFVLPGQAEPIKIGQSPPATPTAAATTASFTYYIGVDQIKFLYEFLNSLAPNAKTTLALTEGQEKALEAPLAALNLVTNNPVLAILAIIGPPILIFVLMNWEEILKSMKNLSDKVKTLSLPKWMQLKKKDEKDGSSSDTAAQPGPVLLGDGAQA